MNRRLFPSMMLMAALLALGAAGAFADLENDMLNAASAGDMRQIERLVFGQGVSVTKTRDVGGKTPLHLAAEEGQTIACIRLMALGANVHARDEQGRTPLHLAAAKGHTETMDCLLRNGADPNARDRSNATPLHAAADRIGGEAVKTLLAHGADPKIRNGKGMTALDIAQRSRRIEVVEALGGVMPRSSSSPVYVQYHPGPRRGGMNWFETMLATTLLSFVALVVLAPALLIWRATRVRRMRRLEAARQGENEAELVQRIWAGLDKMEQRAENLETILLRPDDAGGRA